MKLSFRELINLGVLLGYPEFKQGLCQGFSGMWLEAVCEKDENKFYDRFNFMAKYKNNFVELKEKIDTVKDKEDTSHFQ